MLRFVCLCLLIAGGSQEVRAQDAAPVEARSSGQIFSARMTVQTKGEKQVVWVFHPQDGGKVSALGELKAGVEYKLQSGHLRFGWPQAASYAVIDEKSMLVSRTEFTYEPVTLTLKKGQSLRIDFNRSYEPYDAKYFVVKDVYMALVLPRPYWYQDVGKGQFKGPETFPNSLFFMVDESWGWGESKALDRLAEYAAKEIKAGTDKAGDYRPEVHLSLNVALTAQGKVSSVLTEMPEADLKDLLRAELGKAWDRMKKAKCYRPFDGRSGAAVGELKRAGFLPKDHPEDATYISLAEGLELAKPLMAAWKKANPDKAPKKKD